MPRSYLRFRRRITYCRSDGAGILMAQPSPAELYGDRASFLPRDALAPAVFSLASCGLDRFRSANRAGRQRGFVACSPTGPPGRSARTENSASPRLCRRRGGGSDSHFRKRNDHGIVCASRAHIAPAHTGLFHSGANREASRTVTIEIFAGGTVVSGKSTSMAEFHEYKARCDALIFRRKAKRLVAVEEPVEYPRPDLSS